jgi:hypothetical protein
MFDAAVRGAATPMTTEPELRVTSLDRIQEANIAGSCLIKSKTHDYGTMVQLEERGLVKNRARLLIGDGDVFICDHPEVECAPQPPSRVSLR